MKRIEAIALMVAVMCLVGSDMITLGRLNRHTDYMFSLRDELMEVKSSLRDLQRANLVKSLYEMSNEQLMQLYRRNKGDIDAIWETMPEHSRLEDVIAEMIHRDNIEFEEQGGCMGACDQ